MKKVQIDPATQRRPTSRKQNRSARIKEQLTQQMEVQVIPAKADMEGYERPKPRVCAYCRVSTDMDTQALSYELQVQNYTEYITSNPDWEFAGIYADKGISGTSLRHRDDFNRMIADCEAGQIDLIVTKAVTRFARNVVDARPKVSSITLRRTNDIEAEMQLVFNGSISPITVGGTQKNSLKYVQYRYKLTSESSYGSYTSILSSVTQNGTSFSYSNLELCSLDANSSYDFHVYIRDQLNTLSSVSLYFTVPQGTPLVALRKKKVGINTPNPEAALHVVGSARIEGTVTTQTISANSLSGTLPVSNVTGTLPVSKGGTGSTTIAGAIAMLINSEVISPKTINIGANQYVTSSAYGIDMNNSDISGINGLYFEDAADSAGEGINFYRASGTWDRLYAYGGVLYFAPNQATATHPGTRYTVYHSGGATIPLAKGGTGATTAAAARTNLGISCTSLYSGTLSGTTSITFNYGSYKAYIIVGAPSSSSSRVATIIPKNVITTSAVSYQFADETNYKAFKLSYSGTTVTLTGSGGNGVIYAVYGMN